MSQTRRRFSVRALAVFLLGLAPAATQLEMRGGWLLKSGDR